MTGVQTCALPIWSLVFIAVIYLTAPALAILVKGEVYSNLVGTAFADLPAWLQSWARLDSNLVALTDFNRDGVLALSGLLTFKVNRAGEILGGKWTSMKLVGEGVPKVDGEGESLGLIKKLSSEDFKKLTDSVLRGRT